MVIPGLSGKKLVAECLAMIGTVPIYDSVIHYQRNLAELTVRDSMSFACMQRMGDFVTLHCGITRDTVR